MKRQKRRNVPTITYAGISIREVRPGYFMADLQRDGKRERVCFPDLDAAKTHCDLIAGKIRNEGTSALSISPDQRSDASKALALLAGRASLFTAAEFWMLHNGGSTGATVNDIGEAYLKKMERERFRATTIQDRQYKVATLVEALGDRSAASITTSELVKWFDDMKWSPETYNSYRSCFRAIFQNAVKENRIPRNPVADMDKVKSDMRLPTPFTPSDVAAIMRAAEKNAPPIVLTLAVGFFAGLRPGEARGLTWENINFDERFIRVQPETSKVRAARLVEINDTLLAWLRKYRQTTGPVGVSTKAQFVYYMTKKELAKDAGVIWIQDGARKSFATAHIATHGDAGKTAAILGHVNGADVLYKHYRGLYTQKDAAKYWAICPTKAAGDILQFKTA